MRALVVIAVTLCACKPEPRPGKPRDAVPLPEPRARGDAGAPLPPDPTLPAPSEELVAVPDELRELTLTKVASGLRRPVLLTFAPGDDRKRLFVLEQHTGHVRVIENGVVSETPFLDLKGKVSTGNEQGLLGLAFDPEFAMTRKLFVSYTDVDGDSHVMQYEVDAGDPDRVDPKSRRELFQIGQPYSNHNGGHLAFGPDKKLYFGLGDGGAAGDPHGAGQDRDNLLSKMLRFDLTTAEPKPEIAMMGLRNPWRFDFDPKSGDLYIGDVGQDEWESVFALAADAIDGANLGWNTTEGRHCYADDDCDPKRFASPVIDYAHAEGCSVTGGMVYRGAALPELDGVYFYGDFCLGWIRSFRWRPDGVRQHWDWRPVLDPDGQVTQLSSFGRDADGELYVLSLDGTIWRISAP